MQIKLKDIQPNPANPRIIRDKQFTDLKRSIVQFPQMLQKRGIAVIKEGKKWVAIGGNQRYRVLCDIESDMRTAGFQSIYVIRRKDGKDLSDDDKSFIKKRTEDANRRVSTGEGKAIIVGMNRPPVPENIAAIYDKFAVEAFNLPPPANAASPNQ